MSSHHVVRENQEPALVVASLDQSQLAIIDELLEWSPTVVVHEDALPYFEENQIKIDVLFSHAQPDIQQYVNQRPLSDNFLGDALQYLIDKKHHSTNILCETMGADIWKTYGAQLNLVQISGGKRTYTVKSGFSKWKKEGALLWLPDAAADLQITGLRQVDTHEYVKVGDGLFSLSFSGERQLISEQL